MVDVGSGRVDHRHAGNHVSFVDAHPQVQLRGRELGAVVDAGKRTVVLDLDRDHRPMVRASQRHQLREVQLPGDGRGLHVADAGAQPCGIEGVDAGVDLVDRQFLGGGVLVLHDAQHLASILAANYAAQSVGLERGDGDQCHGRASLPPRLDQLGEQHRIDQRHVTREDQHLRRIFRRHDQGRVEGVGRAARSCLEREVGLVPEDLGYSRRVGRVDDQRASIADRTSRVEDVGEHGPAAQIVQHLWLAGLHASAEARREYDRQHAVLGGLVVARHRGSGIVWVASRRCQGRLAKWHQLERRAIASISTSAPRGRAATWTVLLAGAGSTTKRE